MWVFTVVLLFCASVRAGPENCRIVPTCTETDNPATVDGSGCPTCACSPDQSAACMRNLTVRPRSCNPGEVPRRDGRCCLNCIPAPTCTLAQTEACRAAYLTRPVCESGSPRFDNRTCCVDCRVPSSQQCTANDFATCMATLRTCVLGEQPIFGLTQCCPTCRRPALLCNAFAVGRCLAKRPLCLAGEEPTDVPGECCKSCRTGQPTCAGGCSASSACFAATAAPVCATPRSTRLFVRFNDSAVGLRPGSECEGVQEYVAEVVQRFCERGPNMMACLTVRDNLRTMLVRNCQGVTLTSNASAVIVDLDIAVFGATAANADNADNAANIISSAIGDRSSVGTDAAGAVVYDRPTCTTAPEAIPSCTAQEVPMLNRATACYSCRPPLGSFSAGTCTEQQVSRCAASYQKLPLCTGTPERDRATCCFTCRPPPPACPDTRADACRASYAHLPECQVGEAPQFNARTCCVSCRLPVDRPGPADCTRAVVDACLAKRPVCAPDEQPIVNRDISCCAHCRLPERQCSRSDLQACSRTLPACPSGEAAPRITSECCHTCAPVEPPCTPACADRQKCVYNSTSEQASCLTPRVVRVIVRNMTTPRCDDAGFFAKNALTRFCDNADRDDRCRQMRDRLNNMIVHACAVLQSRPGVNDSVAVDFETYDQADAAGAVDATGRKLLEGLIGDAFAYNFVGDAAALTATVVPADDVRVSCVRLPQDTPVCAANQQPVFDRGSGCFSCRQPIGRACTCAVNRTAIRSCALDETPQRGPNCCPTCMPRARGPDCTPGQQAQCEASIASASLPPCSLGQTPMFNRTTCCLGCQPPAPAPQDAPANGACTRSQVLGCLASLPVCADGEQPVAVSSQCGPSCRRPERSCSLSDVASCRSQMPRCVSNEVPVLLEGDCCPTCAVAPPVCPVCADGQQACDAYNGSTVCRALAGTVRVILRRAGDTAPLDCASALQAFAEIIRRRGDDSGVNASARQAVHRLADNLRFVECTRDNDNTFVSVDVPAIPELASQAAEVAVRAAFANADLGDTSQIFNVVRDERVCTVPLTNLLLCAQGVKPALNRATKCYSCRTGSGQPGCTDAQVAACTSFVPAPCAANEQPKRNATTCCPTCRLQQPVCSQVQIGQCKNSYSSLPTCALGSAPLFITATCCYDCRRDPSREEGTPTGQTCTSAQVQSCNERTPVCGNGEQPMRQSSLCCPTCKAPERQCTPVEVARCKAASRSCVSDELPARMVGSCCASCVPAVTGCVPACATGRTCVSLRNSTGSCRLQGTIIQARITGTADSLPPCGSIIGLLQEVTSRFCDNLNNAAACDDSSVQDNLAGLLLKKCTPLGSQNQSLDIDIVVPADTTASGRRRDATSTTASLLVGAMGDSSSTSGMSVSTSTTESSSSSDNTPIIAGAAAGGAALVAVAIAAIMLAKRRAHGRLSTPTRVTPTRPDATLVETGY